MLYLEKDVSYLNASGAGQVTIRDLIKSSLRMRPERIIVGECRGGEALDMLQAMNTGHDGSLSTGHANSTEDIKLLFKFGKYYNVVYSIIFIYTGIIGK